MFNDYFWGRAHYLQLLVSSYLEGGLSAWASLMYAIVRAAWRFICPSVRQVCLAFDRLLGNQAGSSRSERLPHRFFMPVLYTWSRLYRLELCGCCGDR